MAIELTTISTVIITDLGERTFTHPLVDYDLTSDREFTYSEVRSSNDLGVELDAGNVTIKNNGITIANSSALKKVQPEPNTDTGGGLTFADVWAANTLMNC